MKKIIPFHKEITFRTMIGEITEISLNHSLEFTDPITIEGNFFVTGKYKMTEASQLEEKFDYQLPFTIEIDPKYDTKEATISIDDFHYEVVNDDELQIDIEVSIDGLSEMEEHLETLEDEISLDLRDEDEQPIAVKVEKDDFLEERSEQSDIPAEDKLSVENNTYEGLQSLDDKQEVPTVMEESQSVAELSNHLKAIPIPVETKEKVIPVNQSTNGKETNDVGSIFSALENTDETFSTYYVYIVRDGDTIDMIMDKYGVTTEAVGSYNNLDDIKIGSKLIIPCVLKND